MMKIHKAYRDTFLDAVRTLDGPALEKAVARISEEMQNDPQVEANLDLLNGEVYAVFDSLAMIVNGSPAEKAVYSQMVHVLQGLESYLEAKRQDEAERADYSRLTSNPHFALF